MFEPNWLFDFLLAIYFDVLFSTRIFYILHGLRASINNINKQGGGSGSPKCQQYYISLFNKLVNNGDGEGVKILRNLPQKFMDAPFVMYRRSKKYLYTKLS